jgi:hypothetical protein
LGTAAISGAVAMTYMTTRPEAEVPAETAQVAAVQVPSVASPVPAATQIAAANPNAAMRTMGPPAPTPVVASKIAPLPVAEPAPPRVKEPVASKRTAKTPPMEPAIAKTRVAASRGPMPETKQEVVPEPAGAGKLTIALNLIDQALWGEERWRDAAEPEKIARFVVDDTRFLTLQMYAHDLGNGVARFGVRGTLMNSSVQERLVKLQIELVNGSEVALSIPLEVEIDEEEEEEFDHELDMAAANIKASPPTRVRITLRSEVVH